MSKSTRTFFTFVFACLATAHSATADIRLPGFFGDHMVLQQQMPIKIRGWADAGEAVTVTLGNVSGATTTDKTGNWQLSLPAMKASHEALTLKVKGKNVVEFTDILIGEVWLCSGQSNMEWPVSQCTDAAEEIAAANYPLIRHMKVDRRSSTTPVDDIVTPWQVCSAETVGRFTACGYFMARRLHKELNVPIGLLNSSWGGTRIEPWTPPSGFAKVEALTDIYNSVMGRTPGTPEYTAALEGHITAVEEWTTAAKSALAAKESSPVTPAFPPGLVPFRSHQDPTMLYNSMIHAMVGFPIKGAIWYQGESNRGDSPIYFDKKKALINGWRDLWQQGNFPFYFVQIAPFQYGSEDPTILARFWETQAATLQIPDTGMVVINDLATLKDIHPPMKQEVGVRLANLALKNDYGRTDIVAESPEFASFNVQGQELVVQFTKTAGGLKTRDGKTATHFELIGNGSGGFQPAVATISGDTVILTSDAVPQPTAFRFAWHKLAEPNLTGGTGLPVGAVRGGMVPEFTSGIPEFNDYQLVYDLDLSRLKRDITYDVDNSASIGSFDRIAYQLDLSSSGGPQDNVFVSMNAFTKDARKTGIPTATSAATFQQKVGAMNVYSNVEGVTTGQNITSGCIEFWPQNYSPSNAAKVEGASESVYDFGDSPSGSADGYGSMQIHNATAKQSVFALNHWSAGNAADIGIGNSTGKTKDWTFKANAGSYSSKRLRVYVRSK